MTCTDVYTADCTGRKLSGKPRCADCHEQKIRRDLREELTTPIADGIAQEVLELRLTLSRKEVGAMLGTSAQKVKRIEKKYTLLPGARRVYPGWE